MGVRLTDDEAWERLAEAHTAVLTTLRRDGWPVSLPLWFVAANRLVHIATPARSKKVTRIRHDDRGCLLVEWGEKWTELAAVELPVRAVMVDDADEAAAAAARLAEKYAPYRPAPTRLPDATASHYASGQAVIRLEPAGPLITWDNSRIRLRDD